MNDSLYQQLAETAAGCRVLHVEGHADMTPGHLSPRDPEGRGVWMKRSGIGLGEVAGPEDFVLLDFDRQRLEGNGRIHKEWPIHTEVLRARSDSVPVVRRSRYWRRSYPIRPHRLRNCRPGKARFSTRI